MASITYPTRELDVQQVDVLVAGGGPAGVTAAIAAARDGAQTLLIEQFGFLGGMATAGLVSTWAPLTDGQKRVIGGLAWSIIEQTETYMPHIPPPRQLDWAPIDPELLKPLLEKRVLDSGARILYLTQLVDVIRHGNQVTEAIIANKGGLSAIRAQVFIDTTGDADLVARAGGQFEKGDPETGELQPTTMCFVMAGVDAARYFQWQEEKPGRQNVKDAVARAKAAGELDIPEGWITAVGYTAPNALGFNFSHNYDIDGSDPQQLSNSQTEGRKLVAQLARFVRKHCAGCENGWLAATGVMGIRETRRIVGEYQLTVDDYLARRSFEDEILRNAYYLDVHWSKKEFDRRGGNSSDWHLTMKPYEPGESHGVPYRCLIPKGLTNVLVAGRCLSADRPTQGAVRCMPHCMVMGEAAGAAAAMTLNSPRCDVRNVNTDQLRDKLRSYGGYLPEVKSA